MRSACKEPTAAQARRAQDNAYQPCVLQTTGRCAGPHSPSAPLLEHSAAPGGTWDECTAFCLLHRSAIAVTLLSAPLVHSCDEHCIPDRMMARTRLSWAGDITPALTDSGTSSGTLLQKSSLATCRCARGLRAERHTTDLGSCPEACIQHPQVCPSHDRLHSTRHSRACRLQQALCCKADPERLCCA